MEALEPLELTFSVDCPVDRAFDLWSRRMSMWWPSGHSVSGDSGLTVTFEPHVGGRIFERTPAGEELVYLWHLRFDRSDATEVEVSFEEAGDGTAVRIVHRGWERLGAVAEERRDRNRRGWAGVTERYRAACATAA